MIFFNDFDSMFNQVLGTLAINMRARADRTAITLEEYIATQRAAGMPDNEIRQLLSDDLNKGGRIFGEFFNGMGMDISGRLGELTRGASRIRFGFVKDSKIVWIAVSIQEGQKACPDCEPRHGEVDTYENWVLRGLPKTGWSVCRTNCKCILMNESDVADEESLKTPIRVNKGE